MNKIFRINLNLNSHPKMNFIRVHRSQPTLQSWLVAVWLVFRCVCLFMALCTANNHRRRGTTLACQRRRWRWGYRAPKARQTSLFLVGEFNFRDFFRVFMLFCCDTLFQHAVWRPGPHQYDVWGPLPPACHGHRHRLFRLFGLCYLLCRVLKCP
jgi:hypothetical protein